MFKIEADVLLPSCPSGRNGGRKRDPHSFVGKMRRLAVGETFFAPGKRSQAAGAAGRIIRQRDGVTSKFSARAVTENGVPGVRVWRVS